MRVAVAGQATIARCNRLPVALRVAEIASQLVLCYGYISQHIIYCHSSRKRSRGAGRGRANDDESRACVCLTVEMPDAGRIERRGRSISCAAGRPKVARGVVFGVEFVTIL